MPFLGSFTNSRSFGGGGGGSIALSQWLQVEGFTLVSGTAGTVSAVYQRTYNGDTISAWNSPRSTQTYTLSAPPIPVSLQVLLVAGGSGAMGGLGGGGGAGGSLYHGSYSVTNAVSISIGQGSNGTAQYNSNPGSGTNSTFGTLTVAGGGSGGIWSTGNGNAGGCGGGSNAHWGGTYNGGGVIAPSNPGATHYGHRGGNKNESPTTVGPGGGGASSSGAGGGGNGRTILGISYGGGGGGGSHTGFGTHTQSQGGSGGGGPGCVGTGGPGFRGTAPGAGGGCANHSPNYPGGAGHSGICVIRVRGDGTTI